MAELVDGEQQQPGGEHEGGGQRRHVPGGEQVDQRHHHDRGDGGPEDEVDGHQEVEVEEEGQGDPDQDAVEAEQGVADQRPDKPGRLHRSRPQARTAGQAGIGRG
ncbi:MAG TPA: hypothetical protein VOA19_19330 [Actinomycetes bacterium]|nr:hypothetical protein [Actinomycetes bacterium]